MARRPSTTCLPLLALVVALFLFSHDAMMAAGPHDAGAHAGQHGDHGPADDDTACGELVAARTTDAGPDIDIAAAPGDAAIVPLLTASNRIASAGAGVIDGPSPSRAMLQVWLN